MPISSSEVTPASATAPVPKPHWLESWHVNPSINKDYDAIDGLRGLAILMVLMCHLTYTNPDASTKVRLVGEFFTSGYWGVYLFFCLSGFLISQPFWKRKFRGISPEMPSGYARRRFWKIYPPLALSVLVLTPIYIAINGEPKVYLATAAAWLTGIAWLHPVSSRINPVMWSLIIEVHFYAALPVLFLALRRVKGRTSVFALSAVLLFVPAILRWWYMAHGQYFELHPVIRVNFPSQLDCFAIGVFLAGIENLHLGRKAWAKLGDVGLALLAMCMVATAWFTIRPIAQAEWQQEVIRWGVETSSALLLCYVFDPTHPRTRLFSAPWLRWCGIISYEWYLFHQPITLWARQWIGPAHGSLAKYALIVGGSFLISLALAALVYRIYSLPILKFGRGSKSSH